MAFSGGLNPPNRKTVPEEAEYKVFSGTLLFEHERQRIGRRLICQHVRILSREVAIHTG
jgi:hypothetical protein